MYEGTPGGAGAPREWFWGNDRDGRLDAMPDFVGGERSTGGFRWAYFGRQGVGRVLVLAQGEEDGAPDGMTVFGFGRGREAKPLLREAGRTFLVGLVEDTEHRAVRARVERWLRESLLVRHE
jgi:hypothetical protein